MLVSSGAGSRWYMSGEGTAAQGQAPHRLPSYKTKSVYLNQMIDVDNSAFDYIVRELFIKFRMANDQKYVIREFVCWCTGGMYS